MPTQPPIPCEMWNVLCFQYNNNQYAEMVRLQLQYKSVRDKMSRLQMQLANVDSQIVPGRHSSDVDRYLIHLSRQQGGKWREEKDRERVMGSKMRCQGCRCSWQTSTARLYLDDTRLTSTGTREHLSTASHLHLPGKETGRRRQQKTFLFVYGHQAAY